MAGKVIDLAEVRQRKKHEAEGWQQDDGVKVEVQQDPTGPTTRSSARRRSPSGSGGGEHGAPGRGEAGAEEREDAATGLSRGCPSRTFAVDVFACVRCGGQGQGVSSMKEAGEMRVILEHPGLPTASARRTPLLTGLEPRGGLQQRGEGGTAQRYAGLCGRTARPGARASCAWATATTFSPPFFTAPV